MNFAANLALAALSSLLLVLSFPRFNLSALMLAVINGRDAIVGVLADAGADRTIRGTGAPGFAGKTALDIALEAERVIASALLRDG